MTGKVPRARTTDDRDAREPGHRLLEELQPVSSEVRPDQCHSGHIAARVGDPVHDAATHRVGADRHDDRNGRRRLLGRQRGRRGVGHDQIDLLAYHLGSQVVEPSAVGRTLLDTYVVSVGPATLPERLTEDIDPR
jgi:hypothetical protein